MMRPKDTLSRALSLALFGTCFIFAAPVLAATDRHGNVGYLTAAQCDAAVTSGTAKFYEPFTDHPPLQRTARLASSRAN